MISFLKNLIFPVYCLCCQKEGDWLCDKCLLNKRIDYKKKKLKIIRVKELEAFALFNYNDIVIEKLVWNYKYGFSKEIEKFWNIFLENLNLNFLDNYTIIPVPLHKRRLRERGFNQSEEIAKIIFKNLINKNFNIKIDINYLGRKKYTKQQAKLNKAKRELNLEKAFYCIKKEKKIKNVLLIDDVLTTGSTLYECYKVLKGNGVENIKAFVLAS